MNQKCKATLKDRSTQLQQLRQQMAAFMQQETEVRRPSHSNASRMILEDSPTHRKRSKRWRKRQSEPPGNEGKTSVNCSTPSPVEWPVTRQKARQSRRKSSVWEQAKPRE